MSDIDPSPIGDEMDFRRFRRAMEIDEADISLEFLQLYPTFKFKASIVGSKGAIYEIVIDEENMLYAHDCPDYIINGKFCKHLGKICSLFPLEIQEVIISIFRSNRDRSLDPDDAMEKNREIISKFHPSPILTTITPKYLEFIVECGVLISSHLQHLLAESFLYNPKDFFQHEQSMVSHAELLHDILTDLGPAYRIVMEESLLTQNYPSWIKNLLTKVLETITNRFSIDIGEELAILL